MQHRELGWCSQAHAWTPERVSTTAWAEGSRLSKRGKLSEEDVGEGKEGSASPLHLISRPRRSLV